jgi:hypothetical protein
MKKNSQINEMRRTAVALGMPDGECRQREKKSTGEIFRLIE